MNYASSNSYEEQNCRDTSRNNANTGSVGHHATLNEFICRYNYVFGLFRNVVFLAIIASTARFLVLKECLTRSVLFDFYFWIS